jgi:hypothetical protein
MGLLRNIIESAYMGKHGSGVQMKWKGGASCEDGMQKKIRGVSEGLR